MADVESDDGRSVADDEALALYHIESAFRSVGVSAGRAMQHLIRAVRDNGDGAT